MDIQVAKPSVLFVDDEPNLLSGYKRSLRGQRNDWDMYFVNSGNEAIQLLQDTHVDIVVSDMWMPGMDGAELLNRVARLQPETIRFVLSGHSDEQSIMSLVGITHRFIAKPCDTETLKSILNRAFMLKAILRDSSLKSAISAIDSLPSCSSIASHCRLGAYLLGLWGLPETVVEAVAYTHWPENAPTQRFSTVTAVHVADALLQNDQRLNMDYLANIGVSERLPARRALATTMQAGNES